MTGNLDGNAILMQTLERTLQTQEKMSDDIADIKGTLKEAAKVVSHLGESLENVRSEHKVLCQKVETIERTVEKHPQMCPAMQRHSAWSFSMRDVFWIAAMLGSIAAVYAALKG